jgi:hypothetical protein
MRDKRAINQIYLYLGRIIKQSVPTVFGEYAYLYFLCSLSFKQKPVNLYWHDFILYDYNFAAFNLIPGLIVDVNTTDLK